MAALVIDNEPEILSGMTALLKNWGCLIWTVQTGEEALAIVRSAARSPDIVLTDYNLDKGNGLDVIAALHAKIDPALPAVLFTADRSPAVKRAAEDMGVAVLRKPIKPAALRALMAQAGYHRLAAE